MKRSIKNVLVMLLVLVLVVGSGFYSYGNDEPSVEPVDPETPLESEEPGVPTEPEEPLLETPVEPEEPVDPETPVDPVDPETPIEPEEPIEPVDPETPGEPIEPADPDDPEVPAELPKAILIVNHILIEEEVEQIIDTVISEDLEVGTTVYSNDYILDNEGLVFLKSNVEELTLIEGENSINIYYEQPQINMLAAEGNGLEENYPATSEVYRLRMTSKNDNTLAIFAWLDGKDLYLAIGSHFNKEILSLKYEGTVYSGPNLIVDRANDTDDELTIGGTNYGMTINYYDPGPSTKWNVVKISNMTLVSPFKLSVLFGGNDNGGHDLVDINVYADKLLQVYHKYGEEDPVLDKVQSGFLDSSNSYNVHPVYEKDEVTYTSTRIEVTHNGVRQDDQGPSDLNYNGYLNGTVIPKDGYTSAIITFIYEKVNYGELTITKTIKDDPDNKYEDKEFDIFIYGPNNKTYVVSLKSGCSITLTGLEYGEYRIEEVVPMNFKLVDITNNGTVEIGKDNKEPKVIIENKHTNDGWFTDEDEVENKFTVRVQFDSDINTDNENEQNNIFANAREVLHQIFDDYRKKLVFS